MRKLRFGSFSLASLLVLLLCAGSSFAQGGTTVRGTVQDPNGNLVKGATVTITDPSKNFTRTQQTNEDGQYVFTAVPPGTYNLVAWNEGTSSEPKPVTVPDGGIAELDFTLR